jgi:probable phosphoglycerate mutase
MIHGGFIEKMNNSTYTKLVVIRHGETVWNKEGRQQGHLDSNLSDLGKLQAQAIASALARVTFHALYSSDLGRAFETAKIIANHSNLQITVDSRLRERNLGISQGLTIQEFKLKYPEEYRNFVSRDIDYIIPEGESIRQRFERSIACAVELAFQHTGQRILLVTHGGILDSLFRKSLNLPLTEERTFSLYNASINEFSISNNSWKLDSWGNIHHLQTLDTLDDS